MKVFIGGLQSCSVHTEKETIENLLLEKNIDIVYDPKDRKL